MDRPTGFTEITRAVVAFGDAAGGGLSAIGAVIHDAS
jgi:hypothetical protein